MWNECGRSRLMADESVCEAREIRDNWDMVAVPGEGYGRRDCGGR